MSEEEMNQTEPQAEEAGIHKGVASTVEGVTVEVDSSLVGAVSAGQNAMVSNSLTLAVMAGENTSLENSITSVVMAGENVEINNGGAGIVATGGNVAIHNGGGGMMICQQATLEHTQVNVLIGGQVTLGEGAKVLMSTQQAAAFGAAVGAALAVVGWLLRRRR